MPSATLQMPSTLGPHPAVVRVFVAEGKSQSIGSGTLIHVRDKYGLIVTNWHVVRDAIGEISVVFPDGFQSAARIVKVDKDWDLAALSIWRPQVSPVVLATEAPRIGEILTIAGYGSEGKFRSVSGPCTQYMAPSEKHPFEFVELQATARKGDSGGPIFNQRGELAGVLFGTVEGTTTGSYGGRVWKFVASLLQNSQDLAHINPSATVTKPTQPETPIISSASLSTPKVENVQTAPIAEARIAAPLAPIPRLPDENVLDDAPASASFTYTPFPYEHQSFGSGAFDRSANNGSRDFLQEFLGRTPIEQAKAFLATIGLFTMVYLTLKWNQSSSKN